MVSIRDVAKLANTSSTTVSRVLRKKGYVSKKTEKRILEAMEQLDYVPNELARQLFTSKTYIIGVIVPDIAHPFFSQVVKNIEIDLYANGYKIMLCNSIYQSNREKDYLDMLRSHMVDGIIMCASSLDAKEYKKFKMPIVALDRFINKDIPMISVDHKIGGIIAAEKLISSGCKNVIQFAGNKHTYSPSQERHTSFEKTMLENNINIKSFELEHDMFEFEKYVDLISKTITDEVDGIFSVDLVCIAALHVLKRRGKKIPEDVNVIGYDGILLTNMNITTLTTVAQPIDNISTTVVKTMINLINGIKPADNHIIVPGVKLVEGDTTSN